MIKLRYTFIILITLLCIKSVGALEIHIFDKKLNFPENCYFIVNNKTFVCEDINGFGSSIKFSKPEEEIESLIKTKNFAKTKKDQPVLEVITSEVSGKKHSLVLLKEPNEMTFYVYSICGKEHCISIFTSEMALIYSVLSPVTEDFIFWDAVDVDS